MYLKEAWKEGHNEKTDMYVNIFVYVFRPFYMKETLHGDNLTTYQNKKNRQVYIQTVVVLLSWLVKGTNRVIRINCLLQFIFCYENIYI